MTPQWGTADAEKKTSLENPELPFKPLAGLCIAMHAMPTARDIFLANFYFSSPFTRGFCLFLFENFSQVFPVLAVANTGSCVVPHNRIGHHTHHYRQLMTVPVLSAHGV